jgi:hypothetical protein
MWCQKCTADVAAMASSDNERLFCTSCGTELPRPAAATAPIEASAAKGTTGSTRSPSDPRELLARWAREDALGSLDLSLPSGKPTERQGRAQLRFDAPHGMAAPQTRAFEHPTRQELPTPPRITASRANEAPLHDLTIHPAHGLNPPHFTAVPVSSPVPAADRSSRWVTFVGQIFAYFGVGGLTVGTVLVLMGYFGGPASYATTGWLVTTAGQMLLFLGVITLVSGGMEQTTQEVARRIETIGERLGRMETAARGPAVPHAAPHDTTGGV